MAANREAPAVEDGTVDLTETVDPDQAAKDEEPEEVEEIGRAHV